MTRREWRLELTREVIQHHGPLGRTFGSYGVYIDGEAVPGLSGGICEALGPGDNSKRDNGKRIEEGEYPVWTQFGRYRSIGYGTAGDEIAFSMPALLLRATGQRDGILIHPGHPPNLYLSSVGCLNPTKKLGPSQLMDFSDSRNRVIALIDSLREIFPDAFKREVTTKVHGAAVVVKGEPKERVARGLAKSFALAKAAPEQSALPISKKAAITCAQWMLDHYGDKLRAATRGKPYRIQHLCAIVCQETAYKWLNWIHDLSPQAIIERCVFDASGDVEGAPRSAFPKNTPAFKARYDSAFCDMLIEEANMTRRLQKLADRDWIYKGYGIFQYDLQHVITDEDFFRMRQWRSFDICLARCCKELDEKLVASRGDLWRAIRMYNGSGPSAEKYMENVRTFTGYCEQVTGP
ncbi:peptidase S8/S53 subtilisin kexin sedolisin [Rhizobium leguminosarum]|uniref:Peptidase S8/S53 subtilisin kexin sedolisin n=1 Tax=Rhizobium leguminosarum TaxID=384 RepID=A0A7K3VK00_RHILE|nr:peptidase S8/S53 subtilisin kexin sedolisin [Rhizobium leguminosarum]NEK17465.1 peptidase S8/S53 subtilisin kexin sedolisin [Rhizobium leguminosarum]